MSSSEKLRRQYPITTSRSWTTENDRTIMQKLLIVFGLVLLALGLLWPWIGKLGLGRLPGDIVVERDGMRIFFPIMTSLLISGLISLILWIMNC